MASRTDMADHRPAAARTAGQAEANTTMATPSARIPRRTSSWACWLPAPLAVAGSTAPAAPSRRTAPARKPMPTGTARWWVFFGAGGWPASAATIGVLVIAFAGREAAK